MLSQDQIKSILDDLPTRSYKHHLLTEDVYLTKEMAAALGQSKRKPIRILSAVVEAIAAKMEVISITTGDTSDDNVTQWLALNKWDKLQKDIWRAVVRDGVTYVLVGYENTAPVLHQIDSYDGRTGATIIYADSARKIPLYGVNIYYVNGKQYLDVYYPNRIEKYIYNDVWEQRRDVPGEQWPIDWTDTSNTPLGIALVEFNIGLSDLANGAVQLQRDINEALLDMIAVSRNQGWPQRYIKNASSNIYLTSATGQPILNQAGVPLLRTIALSPGSIQTLKENEEIGQLDAAKADDTPLNQLWHALYVATTVPVHHFTGEWPSGVALVQSESKLNHRVETHQLELTSPVESMVKQMLVLSNTFGATPAVSNEITIDVTWYSPEILTIDLQMEIKKTDAQVVSQLRIAGVLSVDQAVRMLHPDWEEDAVQREVAAIRAEKSIDGLSVA